MPHPDHPLQSPEERAFAAKLLRWHRKAPKAAREWVKYESARLAQKRRQALQVVTGESEGEN